MRTLYFLVLAVSLAFPSCRRQAPASSSTPAAAPSNGSTSVAPPASSSPSTSTNGSTAPAPPANTASAPAGPPNGQPAATPPAIKPMPANIPAVVARVNGESIERWEFDNAVKRIEARAGGAVPPDKRDEVLRGVVDQLVAFHLLAQESRARKMEVGDADVEAQMGMIRGSFPDDKAFQQSMAAQGLTIDQVRQQTRTGMLVQKLIEAEVSSKVVVQ